MGPLTCPLCCNEQFSSHLELNHHILGMIDNIDNLSCPSCKEPCEDLMDLADHLVRECVNLSKSTVADDTQADKSPIEKKQNLIQVKKEFPAEELNEQVCADADNQKSAKKSSDPKEIQDDPNMIYSCEMCDMTFTSVEEHLAKYHDGEEVLLETEEAEEEPDNNQVEDNENYIFNDENGDELLNDNDGSNEEMPYNAQKKSVSQNILSDDQMKDEALAINSASDSGEIEPRATKYIIEHGKICSITDEEASKVPDQSKIFNVYNCSNCKLKFPNLSHFNQHKCNVVVKDDSTFSKLERKSQILKIKEGLRYQCSFCQVVYSCLISLNDHMKSHLIEDESGMVQKKTVTMTLHKCNICNTKFPTFKQLRLHLRMHAPVKAKKVEPPVTYNVMGQADDVDNNSKREKFDCSICGKEYDKGYEEVHMKSHTEDQFICVICNRKFDFQDNLTLHIKAHSNNKKFLCSYCKKPFQTYEALEDHVTKKCQQRDFECQYCGRRFSRPHEKVKHERIHTGEKPHVCEICGKTFRIGYCLTLHMRTHTGSRPYTCDHCGKRFKSCSVFNHHLKTHSEERNYKCPFCPKAFKTAVQLAGHKNSHTKPFSCTECNRPFASLYAVRAHMDTHSRKNNLKHECWFCGASYARSFALRDHITEVHGDEEADRNNEEENVMETDVDLEAADSQSASEEVTEENQDQQIVTESGDISPDQVLGEAESEVYEVHMEEDESGEPVQENSMQVVKSW